MRTRPGADLLKYGKYDDPELFDTRTPATIKNLGVCSELRAS